MVKPSGKLFAAQIKRDFSADIYKIVKATYPIETSVHINLQQIGVPLASLQIARLTS